MLASRCGFLGGLLAFGAAPAVVRIENIMPVRTVIWPVDTIWAIGINKRSPYGGTAQ